MHFFCVSAIAEYGPDGFPLAPQRQKRMRTSFKHNQLRVLKTYFDMNSNPDSKELNNLAEKTGLSKRVLQVRRQVYLSVYYR